MNKSLNVFFAIDKNYVQHFTVAVTSLLENNKDLELNVFVIHDITDLSVLDVTIKFIKEKYDLNLQFVSVGNIDFSNFRTTEHYTKSTYFRLLLAKLLPEEIESGLFLDSDLIVNGSIKELAEISLDNKYICAVSEVSVDDNVARLNKIGFPVKSYFNAGVILVNLKAWRKENITEKLLSIINKYTAQLDWVDQDVLNMYFANNWFELNKKFNAIHLIKRLTAAPVIVHYASYSKPWHYVDTHPYNYLYWRYLALTPFAGSRPAGFSLKNFILKNGRLIKRKLRERGIISEYSPKG
jgi:lipopolysaccharide biosynthesis glycosyltransferase